MVEAIRMPSVPATATISELAIQVKYGNLLSTVL